jgi:membrane protease subunit HflC
MNKLILVIAAVLLGVAYSSVFVVHEGQRGIAIQFGKVKRDSETGKEKIFEPGLHFKVPVIDSVKTLDARIQTLDGQPDRFLTSEKKDLIVDSYVKWRIQDFAKYYLSTSGGNKFQAESLLTRRINSGLRTEFGTRTISDIVSGERQELMREAMRQASSGASELGIAVVDVRVKRINLPDEVSSSIFSRMRAERNAVAREHRSEGQEQAEIIRADVDRRMTVLLADASRQSRTLRGEGDAEAAGIYAKSYGANPEFYSFLRSLDAYEASFNNKKDVIVTNPDSDFFRYLKKSEQN